GGCLVALGAKGGDGIEAFVLQVLIEGGGGEIDRARVAEVADDQEIVGGDPEQARGVRAFMADEGPAAFRILHNEIADEGILAGQGIAEEVLANAESSANDLSGGEEKGGVFEPYVMSKDRIGGKKNDGDSAK